MEAVAAPSANFILELPMGMLFPSAIEEEGADELQLVILSREADWALAASAVNRRLCLACRPAPNWGQS
jgi:hypothetical protein